MKLINKQAFVESVAKALKKDKGTARELIKRLKLECTKEELYDIKLTIVDELNVSNEDVEASILSRL